jgi:hypothetical protein
MKIDWIFIQILLYHMLIYIYLKIIYLYYTLIVPKNYGSLKKIINMIFYE